MIQYNVQKFEVCPEKCIIIIIVTDDKNMHCYLFYTAVGDGESVTLQPDTYKYAWEYKLQDDLPSSFEGQFGKIRYNCKAVFDIPWAFDLIANKIFTVVGRMDLNEYPDAAVSYNYIMIIADCS